MAENKKSFILYCDLIHTVEKLPKEKAGELFLHILKYVNDLNPQTDDIITQIAFEPIRQQLKRDLQHWNNICLKRSESGKLGGRPKKQIKAKKANAFSEKQTKAKKADNDNVNDNVNDNDNEKEEFKPDEPVNFIEKIVFEFCASYKEAFNLEYSITKGKDHSAASWLLQQYKNKYPAANSEESLMALRHWFDAVMSVDFQYVQENMTLPIVRSKFNEINKCLKNGKYKRNRSKASDGSTVEDVIRDQARKLGVQ